MRTLLEIVSSTRNGAETCNLTHEEIKMVREHYKAGVDSLLENKKSQNRWDDFVHKTDIRVRVNFLALQVIYEIMYYNVKDCEEYVEKQSERYLVYQTKTEQDWFEREIEMFDELGIEDYGSIDNFLFECQKNILKEKVAQGLQLIDKEKYESLTEQTEKQ